MIAIAPLAALAVAAAPCTLPPLRPGPPPWRPGEALAWDVDVMGMVKAGALEAAVQPPMFGGAVVPIRARLRNTSVFAKVRKVRGVAHSWVDARTLRPQRYRDEVDDEGVHRTTDTRFEPPAPKVTMQWTHGDKKGAKEFERAGDVLDLVSAIYYLRAAALAPGAEICFDLVANRRYWRLQGRLAPGTERVETPAGAFEAVRIDATLTRATTPDDPDVKRRPFHLWLSADARRLPVAGVSEVDLGPVRALMSRGASPRAAKQP
jgi:hypothetical protein